VDTLIGTPGTDCDSGTVHIIHCEPSQTPDLTGGDSNEYAAVMRQQIAAGKVRSRILAICLYTQYVNPARVL
jgi:hypothetical protein